MASYRVNVQSVLIEYTYNGKVYANSGCFVDNKFILMTSNAFVSSFSRSNNISLTSMKAGLLDPLLFFEKTPKITVIIKNEDSDHHQYKQGVIIAAYISEAIRKSTVKYLYDWRVDVQDSAVQLKEALSLFFIAAIDLTNVPDFKNVLYSFNDLKLQSSQVSLKAGDKICVESTPFGNRHFLRCHSRGIVSNILGENGCFVLTDVPVAPGSEGSPVFMKYRNGEVPVGIVLSCMSWWKGEWIGLTLAASFETIFSEILGDKPDAPSKCQGTNTLFDVLQRSIAQVTSGSLWGTAVLLNKDKGLFITNSHVIEDDHPVLYWNDSRIRSKILYKSYDNQIYDLALLSANQTDLQQTTMASVKVSLTESSIGDKVYALGFPLFARATKPKPTLTSGHLSQVSRTMLKTTCSVLPGASGGGIFKKDGTLIGLIVCNAKMESNSTAYPRINMAIPILAIYYVLVEFYSKQDVKVLEKLRINSAEVYKEWNFLKAKM